MISGEKEYAGPCWRR